MDKKTLEFLREQYPPGTRVELRKMNDPYNPVPPGTKGTVLAVDDAGTIEVEWDNGRSLGLIPGEDSFRALPAEPTALKLYMPLVGSIFEEDEYGWNEEPISVEGSELAEYEDKIMLALQKNRVPEEAERGLMNWYHEQDTVNEKVRSVEFDAEYREGRLWGVASCKVLGTLNPEELETLKEYITGQASDGWGERFEQQDIRIEGGVLNVHLWNYENWSIQTEEERFGTPEPSENIQKSVIEPQF